MKNEKKRRKFGYYFLKCEGIAIVVAAIAFYICCNLMYGTYIAKVKEKEQTFVSAIAKRAVPAAKQTEYKDEQSFYNQLGYKCAVDAEIEYGNRYSWIEDSQTGEMLADSSRKALLILREKEDGPLATYTCDMQHMKEFWDNYDYPFYSTRPILINYNDMYFENMGLLKALTEGFNLYSYDVKDVYIKDNSFVVGSMDISLDDENYNPKEYVTTYTASSEEVAGYTHIEEEEYSNYKTKFFLSIGGSADGNRDEIKKELGDSEYYLTSDSNPFPGKITMICKSDVTDRFGRNITIYQKMTTDYAHDFKLYNLGNAILIAFISLLTGLIVARRKYLENKYFCDMNEYRKCLMDSMAHDLKSPLAIMGGYAQNLAEDVNGEKRQYYADSIIKNVDYMNKIIMENLELSKLDVTEIGNNLETVDIVAKIKELFEKYNPSLQERKVKVEFEGEFKRKVNVKSIDVALENIVSNAVKYVNDSGEIKVLVKGKQLIVTNTTEEKYDGKSEKLWEPFVKGDKSRGNEKGTGLGLAIAKRVFEMNRLKATLKIDNEKKEFSVVIW